MGKRTWVTASLAAIMLLAAVPGQVTESVVQASEVGDSGTEKKLGSLTTTVTNSLKKAVAELTDEPFTFDSVSDMGSTWLVEGQLNNETAMLQVEYSKIKNRVESTIIRYKISTMDKVLDASLRQKVKSSAHDFNPAEPLEFEAFWRVKSPYQDNNPKDYWVFWGSGERASSLYVDVASDNRITMTADYPVSKVAKTLLDRGKQAVQELSGSKVNFQYATRFRDEGSGSSYWVLKDANEINSVRIGSKTGRLYEAATFQVDWQNASEFDKVFAEAKYTPAKAITKASPAAKKLFNMDLSGYSVSVKANEYTFTRKGQATLVGKINKKGVFYELALSPVNGKLQ